MEIVSLNKRKLQAYKHRLFLASTFIFFLYAQVLVGYILPDLVATSHVGLLRSDTCGLYEYDNEKAGEEEALRADMWMVERERRAGFYAQDCYGSNPNHDGNAMRCDFFYNSTIRFEVKQDKCPFENTTVCTNGFQAGAAVTFDTGLLDSDVLGINANPTHKFRRITTCAPLSVERPYVQHFKNRERDESGYLYFYGSLYNTSDCSKEVHPPPSLISDYTMRLAGHPFDWQAPVYKLK